MHVLASEKNDEEKRKKKIFWMPSLIQTPLSKEFRLPRHGSQDYPCLQSPSSYTSFLPQSTTGTPKPIAQDEEYTVTLSKS
jgi:hypothetical protein